MTREEQIKKAAHDFSWGWCDDMAHPLNDGFIKGAEWADSHPQWIPVEERKPEENQRVWIFTADGRAGIARYDKHGFNVSALLLQVNVTHWMEIVPPSPRKEDKNDNI